MAVFLTSAAKEKPEFKYCLELVEHINLIGSVPIRNTGTIAGNLSIKNEHKEFPSDLYLILEAIGTKITIAESMERTIIVSPEEYVNINMRNKLIVNIILPPKDPKTHLVRSFKIISRAQNCKAYVNSSFVIELNAERTHIESAIICFGVINPNFTHATETEKFLTGSDILTNNNLQTCLQILSNELKPIWTLLDASPEYRKNLAIALFYKFVLSFAAECNTTLRSAYKSGGYKIHRPISTASQEFDTHQKRWPLTRCIRKIEALAQTSGEAKFINDLPRMPNELYAAFVLATEVHADIQNIDATEALNLPGVIAFYSVKDIPGQNDFMPFRDLEPEPEEIFCSRKVLYHGQPVGIVVAETFTLADQASKSVKIAYIHTREPILPTVREVVGSDCKSVRIIDTNHGFTGGKYNESTEGPVSLSGKLELGGQYHFSMETQTCICVPIEDGMDIYSSTQWVDLVQVPVARMLNIPESTLNLQVRRLGGSYGGKASRSSLIACSCALAAHLTRRPVRFIMSLEANMSVIGKRYGLISEYDISVSSEGKIQRLHNRFAHDSGSSYNETPFYINNSYPNCYTDEKWKIEAFNALTDSASNTWCRAPGSTEAIAMIETIMEHIAHATGRDPVDIRMNNMAEGSKMLELLPQFRLDVRYDNRKQEIKQFNDKNRWKKRGILIVPMRYPVGYLGVLHALISIYNGDGSVSIAHGGIEMGQGLNTKVAQVAAHVLGIPMELVSIKSANNLISPNAVCTEASFTSEAVCYAVKKACEILLRRMEPLREKYNYDSWPSLISEAYKENINLCASYMYQ
ncbi:xanthine dehydrogenase-like [Wyeomyia smithii]|uniref:xanthine dehydrogenase-like n=1 Tax=Wyeomyia smithii TaxID=174621 RepID=UPI002467DC93|nr:xanthine dehydrogenase-like [Wyeomyia smithii]